MLSLWCSRYKNGDKYFPSHWVVTTLEMLCCIMNQVLWLANTCHNLDIIKMVALKVVHKIAWTLNNDTNVMKNLQYITKSYDLTWSWWCAIYDCLSIKFKVIAQWLICFMKIFLNSKGCSNDTSRISWIQTRLCLWRVEWAFLIVFNFAES